MLRFLKNLIGPLDVRSPRLWIALSSTALVVTLAIVDSQRTSPGPLATVHEREGDLTGFNSCAHCHGGWFGEMTESCLECHDDIGAQIGTGKGLHGVVGAEKANNCALCHSEHHGRDFALVNKQSFLQAGVPDASQFDHAMVGFAMDGKHLETACTECHLYAESAPLPAGKRRFIGLSQDCAECHEDVHEGQLPIGCAKCHGQESFTQLRSDGHEKHLPLIGGHGDVSCRECHATDSTHSLEALGGLNPPPARTCTDCHDTPHRESFFAETGCAECHEPWHTSFVQDGLTVTPEQHAASGFPLDVPHDQVACEKCHAPANTYTDRYPGRDADTCSTCHEDPHDSQFGAAACLSCHDRQHFDPHAFTTERHAETKLPLDGKHLEAECAACHKVPEAGAARVFRGTPSTCKECHADAHRGFFADEKGQAVSCKTCHLTTSFSDVPSLRFDHGESTGFVVRAAHAQEECEACHKRTEAPDEAGRTFGRVEDQFGTFRGCVTCHKDPHRGLFDLPELPQEVDGKKDCARCHLETSFRSLPDGFAHGAWTGFPLEGSHDGIGCTVCHEPLRTKDANGSTWGRAPGAVCAACHTDPHAGQFEKDGVTSCERCHRSVVSFGDLKFRHNLDSRFRLEGAHTEVACKGCHKPERRAGRLVVRYRPLGMECRDCHRSQMDPLRARSGDSR
jgi:hypothetical protein